MLWWIVLVVVAIAVPALVVRGRRNRGSVRGVDPQKARSATWTNEGRGFGAGGGGGG